MSDNDTAHAGELPHGSLRAYLIGFILSAILTAIPFWMVMSGRFETTTTAAWIITLAIAQIFVHVACFLHVNRKSEGGWTLVALVFTAVIVLISIAGSLWIMYHLNLNMMPMGAM